MVVAHLGVLEHMVLVPVVVEHLLLVAMHLLDQIHPIQLMVVMAEQVPPLQ